MSSSKLVPGLATERCLHQPHTMVDTASILRGRSPPCGTDVEDDVGDADDIVGDLVFLDPRLRRDADCDDMERESRGTRALRVHPGADPSEHIGIASLDDEADVSLRDHEV